MSSGASRSDRYREIQRARIASGRCRLDSDGTHLSPEGGTYCRPCMEKINGRRKGRREGAIVVTDQTFWDAMQDMYYAGRL
jgi:hypothetical protein